MSSSTHTLLRRAACLAAAVVALPALAAPAVAASTTVDDARSDVVRVLEGGSEPTPAPHATIGDFVRTTFRHTAHRVVVQARFVDLARTGKRFTMWVDMRDQDRHKTTLGVQATRRHRAGTAFLMTNRGVDIPCRVVHRIDYRRNTVRASFPRRCVGNPHYLQFRALSEHVRSTWKYAWLDNGLARNVESRAWTGKVRVG